jgi:flavin-dependent dehydrogenase
MGELDFPRPPRPEGEPPPEAFCPRRTVLDKILVDAAVAAGVEVHEGVAVKELLWDGDTVAGIRGQSREGGAPLEERARIVIGADGLHSIVAKSVQAPEYNTKPSMSFGYYAYWSGVTLETAQIHFMEDGGILAFPTNDGLYCLAAGGPGEMFPEFRKDIEGNYMKIMERQPVIHEAMRNAKREERFVGTNDQPNFFRKPFGAGWALVGDAGYHRDFVTGLGITDAFRDAELLTEAIDDGFAGRKALAQALTGYEERRNTAAGPLYELTTQLVSGEPPTIEQFANFAAAMQAMMPQEVA